MYRILIAEDERSIAEALSELIGQWGMEPRIVENFRNVMEVFGEFQPHLVLLDLKLPYQSGYYWCARIREQSSVPVCFLSSASDSLNMVTAMEMGADDFISKPFDPQVLMAKLQAMLRRAYAMKGQTNLMMVGGAELDPDEGTVRHNGQSIELTRNEKLILMTLFQSKNTVVSREKLMEALWKTDCFVDDNTLTVNVNRLRKKLSGIGLEGLIVTRFGQGYIVQ